MLGYRMEKNLEVLYFLLIALSTLAMVAGCVIHSPNGPDTDSESGMQLSYSIPQSVLVQKIRTIAESDYLPLDMRHRAQTALLKLENGFLDRRPTLIQATLNRTGLASGWATLLVVAVDEDLDLRGLRVREECMDPNGKLSVIEEEYPVYVYSLESPLDAVILGEDWIDVRIRTGGQRKDKDMWQEYMIRALDKLVRKLDSPKRLLLSGESTMLIQENPNARKQSAKDTSTEESAQANMPPIWISVPDHNKVHVFVSLYDRAGNQSETVEIEDWSWRIGPTVDTSITHPE